MNMIETIYLGFLSIFAHPLRSFLTVLGIIIGIASVIILISIGESLRVSVIEQFQGTNATIIRITPQSEPLFEVEDDEPVFQRLSRTDAEALLHTHTTPAIVEVAAQFNIDASIQADGHSVSAQVSGVTPNFIDIDQLTLVVGRFFQADDELQLARVAVIPQSLVYELFPGFDALGHRLTINGYDFEIIGITQSEGTSFLGETIYVPLSVVQQRLGVAQTSSFVDVSEIIVVARDEGQVELATEHVTSVLRQRHKTGSDQEDGFQVSANRDIAMTISRIVAGLTVFLVLVGGMSLVVGGVGIMNIMLVSVTQRTREIGLRRAMGARQRDILFQFLIEAVVLSLSGGILGIFIGAAGVIFIGNLVTIFAEITIIQGVSPIAIFVATSFSIITGVVFGLYPARQAALMTPIDALRHE